MALNRNLLDIYSSENTTLDQLEQLIASIKLIQDDADAANLTAASDINKSIYTANAEPVVDQATIANKIQADTIANVVAIAAYKKSLQKQIDDADTDDKQQKLIQSFVDKEKKLDPKNKRNSYLTELKTIGGKFLPADPNVIPDDHLDVIKEYLHEINSSFRPIYKEEFKVNYTASADAIAALEKQLQPYVDKDLNALKDLLAAKDNEFQFSAKNSNVSGAPLEKPLEKDRIDQIVPIVFIAAIAEDLNNKLDETAPQDDDNDEVTLEKKRKQSVLRRRLLAMHDALASVIGTNDDPNAPGAKKNAIDDFNKSIGKLLEDNDISVKLPAGVQLKSEQIELLHKEIATIGRYLPPSLDFTKKNVENEVTNLNKQYKDGNIKSLIDDMAKKALNAKAIQRWYESDNNAEFSKFQESRNRIENKLKIYLSALESAKAEGNPLSKEPDIQKKIKDVGAFLKTLDNVKKQMAEVENIQQLQKQKQLTPEEVAAIRVVYHQTEITKKPAAVGFEDKADKFANEDEARKWAKSYLGIKDEPKAQPSKSKWQRFKEYFSPTPFVKLTTKRRENAAMKADVKSTENVFYRSIPNDFIVREAARNTKADIARTVAVQTLSGDGLCVTEGLGDWQKFKGLAAIEGVKTPVKDANGVVQIANGVVQTEDVNLPAKAILDWAKLLVENQKEIINRYGVVPNNEIEIELDTNLFTLDDFKGRLAENMILAVQLVCREQGIQLSYKTENESIIQPAEADFDKKLDAYKVLLAKGHPTDADEKDKTIKPARTFAEAAEKVLGDKKDDAVQNKDDLPSTLSLN